ncbi:hypothetical protein PPERSA_02327 [Pseudocohnilembus persalinus]|uniref:Uncharacterized protein n=1 Tax=Pseudocohnilembus persalinus TaxID=266149 RepID=A0A0V0QTS3_PSEPJ|nr:hypothetical protein PPERSA_02327 [Pseudocohnilembus persalinus]|eukprot:KRX05795.1 hypothetical protein PPERSA_02327 [Pseudocohnilembus persalinus]
MQPIIFKNMQISLLLDNEEDIKAAAQCYIEGYYQSHPLFLGLGIDAEEFRKIITQGIKDAVQQRPLQQLIAKDLKDLSKIVGVYLINDQGFGLSDYKNNEKFSEKMQFKQQLENSLIDCEIVSQLQKEIEVSQNKQLYQTVRLAILKEYQSTGLYSKFNQMAFYSSMEFKLAKAFIDIVYNRKVIVHPTAHLDAVPLNEIKNVRELEFKGEKLLKDQKNLVCILQYVPMTSELAKSYQLSGRRELQIGNKIQYMEQNILLGDIKISFLTEKYLQQAVQCFIEGFYQGHPLYVSLKVNQQEFKKIIENLIIDGIKNRPLQQFIAQDIKNENKVVGAYIVNTFDTNLSGYDCLNNKTDELQYRIDLEKKLLTNDIIQKIKDDEKKNNSTFQTCKIAVLQDYQTSGLFQKFTQMSFYVAMEYKLSIAYIDFVYNQKMVQYPQKNFGAEILNEINIKEQSFKGEKIFQNNKYICATLLLTPFQSQNAKKFWEIGDKEQQAFFKQQQMHQKL